YQGIHIKPATPYQDQGVVAVEQLLKQSKGLPFKITYRIRFKNAFVLDQMVRCRPELLLGGHRGPNAHFLEELPGVGRDDLGTEMPCHKDGQGCFPDGRGAYHHYEDFWLHQGFAFKGTIRGLLAFLKWDSMIKRVLSSEGMGVIMASRMALESTWKLSST